MTDKQELLRRLLAIKENGPENERAGICSNVNYYAHYLTLDLATTWPHYSGCLDYPVSAPGTIGDAAACMMYEAAADNKGMMWSKTMPYGRMRWDLLDHMIKELSK